MRFKIFEKDGYVMPLGCREMDVQEYRPCGSRPRCKCFGRASTLNILLTALLACCLCGCAARPDHWHHQPTNAPPIPAGADCGAPVRFENGETWLYKCWPESAKPVCISGCVRPVPEDAGEGKDGRKP